MLHDRLYACCVKGCQSLLRNANGIYIYNFDKPIRGSEWAFLLATADIKVHRDSVLNIGNLLMKIKVARHFQDLIFSLTDQEKSALEQSILKDGVRDSLVVWVNGANYLLDGHHRWEIIQKHNISDYKVISLHFENKHEAINWVIDNQLARRNCTPEALSYLRGLRYQNEKKSHGGKRESSGKNCHLNTADLLSEAYKVSPKTIRNDEKFADAIESIVKTFPTPKKQKDIKHKILTRQISLSKKDLIELSELSAKYIKEVISGKKELWQVKLEIEQKRKKRKKKHIRTVLPN